MRVYPVAWLQPSTLFESSPGRANAPRYDVLQGLRAIAAAMVVYAHALMNLADKGGYAGAPVEWFDLGDLGVKLFFCISGFIIYNSAIRLPSGRSSVSSFLLRRLIRIVPLYWLITSVVVLKGIYGNGDFTFSEIWRSFLFVPYRNDADLIQPILGLGWSLNFEMFFYSVFGVTLVFRRKYQALIVLSIMAALVAARSSGLLIEDASMFAGVAYYWADAIIFYFMAGMIVAVLQRWFRDRLGDRFSMPFAHAAVLALGGVALFAAFAMPLIDVSMVNPIVQLVCLVAISICVVPDSAAETSRGFFRKLLVLAGDASYSTYLTHGFILGPFARLLAINHVPIGFHEFAAIGMVLSTGFGIIIYWQLELPLSRLIRKLKISEFLSTPRMLLTR